MEMETVVSIVTMSVTWILGYCAKKSSFINNNLIPIQNIAIGLIIAIIEFIITKDFSLAIATSGILAGGSYDVMHNGKKLLIAFLEKIGDTDE